MHGQLRLPLIECIQLHPHPPTITTWPSRKYYRACTCLEQRSCSHVPRPACVGLGTLVLATKAANCTYMRTPHWLNWLKADSTHPPLVESAESADTSLIESAESGPPPPPSRKAGGAHDMVHDSVSCQISQHVTTP